MIEEGLYIHLTTDSDVNNLISTRCYPVKLPQGFSLPALTYQRISGYRSYDLQGHTGRGIPRFQIDCWAGTYSAVRDLANKVRLALNGVNGDMGGENVEGVELVGDRDDFDEQTEYRRVIMEFKIPHKEAKT